MTASFDSIFSRFLGRINDYQFLTLPEETANEFMNEWLYAVVSRSSFRKLFKSFDIKPDCVEFALYDDIDESYDTNFTTELIVSGIMIHWLSRKVYSLENLAQMYGGSEEKFYSQSNHLEQLRKLLADTKNEQRKLIRDHGYDYQVLAAREAE